jgi:hypothetical protein
LPSLGTRTSGASSKAGIRAAQIVRVVRMVRLVRLVKLYKYYATAMSAKDKTEVVKEKEKESHVGAAMSDLTNRRVIMLILSMLIIIPLLTVSGQDYSGAIVTKFIHAAAHQYHDNPTSLGYKEMFDTVVQTAVAKSSVIGIKLQNETYWEAKGWMDKLRPGQEAVSYTYGTRYEVTITFNNWRNSIDAAQFSIGTTIFVIFLLTVR